jgi:hypothetical protein
MSQEQEPTIYSLEIPAAAEDDLVTLGENDSPRLAWGDDSDVSTPRVRYDSDDDVEEAVLLRAWFDWIGQEYRPDGSWETCRTDEEYYAEYGAHSDDEYEHEYEEEEEEPVPGRKSSALPDVVDSRLEEEEEEPVRTPGRKRSALPEVVDSRLEEEEEEEDAPPLKKHFESK